MGMKYLNRFSIEEEDQFEIHVKDYPNKDYSNMRETDFYNAAKEVILDAQQGQGCYRLKGQNYFMMKNNSE